MRGLSPVVASGGHSSSRCAGLSLSLSQPLLLQSTGSRRTGSRRAGSVIVAHGPSCSVACGILPDQGPNPRPPHWQADPQPLRHQGSPPVTLNLYPCYFNIFTYIWYCFMFTNLIFLLDCKFLEEESLKKNTLGGWDELGDRD